MNGNSFRNLIKGIVKEANDLKNKHTDYKDAPVNYACIFSQTGEEYEEFLELAKESGEIIEETKTGFLFHIKAIHTVAGNLKLLKIRIPDSTRPERGDADFTILNFSEFEKEYISKKGFNIMRKENFYMLELIDPEFDVRTYFSNPPLDKQLNIK